MEELVAAAQEMNDLIIRFVKEYTEFWCLCRNDTIMMVLDKADKMDGQHKKANIANIVGSSVAIGGSAVATTGAALLPFTLGVSAAAIGVGASISVAGGLTGAGATVVDHVLRARDKSDVNKQLEQDKSNTSRMQEILQEIYKCAENIEGLQQRIYRILNPEQTVTDQTDLSDHLIDLIQNIPIDMLEECGIHLPKLNDKAFKNAVNLLKTILPVATRFRIWLQTSVNIGKVAAGGVIFLLAIGTVFEVANLIYTVHDMVKNKSETSDAKKLREVVHKLLEEKQEMDEISEILFEGFHTTS